MIPIVRFNHLLHDLSFYLYLYERKRFRRYTFPQEMVKSLNIDS